MPISSVGHLDVILKCAEVCNLNCSYCYYYNMGDTTWKSRPKQIKAGTVARLAEWVVRGIKELAIKKVAIILHGGEPLLLRHQEIENLCSELRAAVEGAGAVCQIILQTNGVLITERWLRVFERQGISVGVSIDGPPDFQDRFRVDKQGNGSSAAVEQGIALLQTSPAIHKGSLSVIDPDLSGAEAYRYLRSLGFMWMDFLIPMDCYANVPSSERVRAVGQFLVDVAEAWFSDADQDAVTVRIIDNYLQAFQQYSQVPSPSMHPRQSGHNPIIVLGVHTDGSIGFREEIFNSGYSRTHRGFSIFRDELETFVNSPAFSSLDRAYAVVPSECLECEFLGVCGGGDLKNRFDPASGGFEKKSVYCEGLKLLFSWLIDHLIQKGYPANKLHAKLRQNAGFLLDVQASL